jgi:DeoR family transcriptional regulator, suf operon transcriptional repressor
MGLDSRKMSLRPDTEPARSRDRILELLLRSEEPLGVQTVAAALGVSRNAAHQHVAALEREGLIERASAIRTKGRPSQGFRLSTAGKATFPRQYALLSKQLLAELSRLGPADLREAMERIGEALAGSLSAQVDPAEAIPSIAALMRELGYESNTVEGAEGLEIEAHNCVFHDLAMADQTICEVDLALLRALSGKSVEHRRCMARGERSCRFAFVPAKA